MDLRLARRTAIVCASSHGLGRACATSQAAAGCDLVLNGRDAAALAATAADLRAAVRGSKDDAALFQAMDEAIARKPKGHDFIIDRRQSKPAVGRHMSVTGG